VGWITEYALLGGVALILYGLTRWLQMSASKRMMRQHAERLPAWMAWPRWITSHRLSGAQDGEEKSRPAESSAQAALLRADQAERLARILEDLYREWAEEAEEIRASIAAERSQRQAEVEALRRELSDVRARLEEFIEFAATRTQSELQPQAASVSGAAAGESAAAGDGFRWDERCLDAVRRLRGGATVDDVVRDTGLEATVVVQLAALLEPPPYPAQ
jgi:hypothetical protein